MDEVAVGSARQKRANCFAAKPLNSRSDPVRCERSRFGVTSYRYRSSRGPGVLAKRSLQSLVHGSSPGEGTKFMNSILRRGRIVAGAGILAIAALAFTGAQGFAEDPPGNNGTVKIDGVDFDVYPNNEPHVGCVFQVDFYGFDQGDLNAKVAFKVWPPTGDMETILKDSVFIGEDPNDGGGSVAGLDAERTYN